MKFFSIEGGLHSVIVEDVVAPAGAPLRFPLKARREASRASTESPGPMTTVRRLPSIGKVGKRAQSLDNSREYEMHRERIAEMRPPIAIDANHFARLSALSSLTSGPMMDVCEYLREELDRAHVVPAENCVRTSSVSAARSNFGTNKPERFSKSFWFIRLMPTSHAGAYPS